MSGQAAPRNKHARESTGVETRESGGKGRLGAIGSVSQQPRKKKQVEKWYRSVGARLTKRGSASEKVCAKAGMGGLGVTNYFSPTDTQPRKKSQHTKQKGEAAASNPEKKIKKDWKNAVGSKGTGGTSSDKARQGQGNSVEGGKRNRLGTRPIANGRE